MNRVFICKVGDLKKDIKVVLSELDLGEKILIKPNFFNSMPANTGVTTDLRLLGELADELGNTGKEIYPPEGRTLRKSSRNSA